MHVAEPPMHHRASRPHRDLPEQHLAELAVLDGLHALRVHLRHELGQHPPVVGGEYVLGLGLAFALGLGLADLLLVASLLGLGDCLAALLDLLGTLLLQLGVLVRRSRS